MICALCGPTLFPVTMRSFTFADQVAYLTVCDTCHDHANVALARRESRAWHGRASPTENDVKSLEGGAHWADRRSGSGRKRPKTVPGRVGNSFRKKSLARS